MYINNPHDKFVRKTLGRRANAVDFLRGALPAETLERHYGEVIQMSGPVPGIVGQEHIARLK